MFLVTVWISVPAQGAEAVQCSVVQKDGSPTWECQGAIDLKGEVVIKVKNTGAIDHGFAIDTMKVYEILKPGEEKTITVPLKNIVTSVPQHFAYCHNHGAPHMFATIKVAGK